MRRLLIGAAVVLLVVYFWPKGTDTVDQRSSVAQPIAAAKKQQTKKTQAAPIHFAVTKTEKMLLLSGTFTNQKQLRLFARNLRPTYSTKNLKKDTHLVDKGGLKLAAKILPLFKKYYIQGEIQYSDGTLIVKGSVPSQELLDQTNSLLKGADIPFKNLTVIDTKTPLPLPKKKHSPKRHTAVNHPVKPQKSPGKQIQTIQNSEKLIVQKTAVKQKTTIKEKPVAQAKRPSPKPTPVQAISKAKIVAKVTHKKLEKPKPQISAKKRIKTLLRQHKIEFLAAKGTLTEKGKKTVDMLAKILSQYKHIHIEIAGHTDSDGSESFNQKLSQLRVDAVKKRLISKGIHSKRMRAKGYGESRPLVPNTSEENKQKNRRVEINVLKIVKI